MIKDFVRYIYNRIKWRNRCAFESGSNVSRISEFEGANCIGRNTHFDGSLGFGTYISSYCDICRTTIGRYTSVASRVVVNPGNHPFSYPFATTCPAFYSTRMQTGFSFVKQDYFEEIKFAEAPFTVKIGNDCWICDGVMIVGGITIGDGAVVLAHSVVTKDVPPYAVVGGVPAKVIKYRYSPEDIDFLISLKWWNKPIDWLKSNSHLLRDLNSLKTETNFL